LHVELRLGLERNEAHRWAGRRLGDRLRVTVVVLLRLHIRPDILRWHQPDLVPERRRGTTNIVRAAARLHRHHATWQLAQQRRDAVPRHTPPEYDLPARRHPHNAAAGLAQVDTENRNFRHRGLLLLEKGNPIPGRLSEGRAIP
jgi:hypothetical protein